MKYNMISNNMSVGSINLYIIFHKEYGTLEKCPFPIPYNEGGSLSADLPSMWIIFVFKS